MTEKHQYATISQLIGPIEILDNFYEYQLYCKSLNASIQKFTKNTTSSLSISNTHNDFIEKMRSLKADGGILTFKDDNPKWSYAKYDDEGLVTEVAEKIVISDQATVGIYYYRHGKDFVRYAEQMLRKNIRINNEFYVCPVYNEFIADGKRIYFYEISKNQMHGLGTPEDLNEYLEFKESI